VLDRDDGAEPDPEPTVGPPPDPGELGQSRRARGRQGEHPHAVDTELGPRPGGDEVWPDLLGWALDEDPVTDVARHDRGCRLVTPAAPVSEEAA
jgi:hypothetical protein